MGVRRQRRPQRVCVLSAVPPAASGEPWSRWRSRVTTAIVLVESGGGNAASLGAHVRRPWGRLRGVSVTVVSNVRDAVLQRCLKKDERVFDVLCHERERRTDMPMPHRLRVIAADGPDVAETAPRRRRGVFEASTWRMR